MPEKAKVKQYRGLNSRTSVVKTKSAMGGYFNGRKPETHLWTSTDTGRPYYVQCPTRTHDINPMYTSMRENKRTRF